MAGVIDQAIKASMHAGYVLHCVTAGLRIFKMSLSKTAVAFVFF
jgi:hypothetical protein